MDLQEKDSGVYDRLLKSVQLPLEIKVVANATPASKVHSSDLPSAVVIASEGKTADIEAAEAGLPYATPVDADGKYSILIQNLGEVDKVLEARIIETKDGGSTTVSRVNSGTTIDGKTPAGNILLDIDATDSLATATQDSQLVLEISYRRK